MTEGLAAQLNNVNVRGNSYRLSWGDLYHRLRLLSDEGHRGHCSVNAVYICICGKCVEHDVVYLVLALSNDLHELPYMTSWRYAD